LCSLRVDSLFGLLPQNSVHIRRADPAGIVNQHWGANKKPGELAKSSRAYEFLSLAGFIEA